MLDTEDAIIPPPNSPAARLVVQLRGAGEPIVLSINNQVEVVMKDETSVSRLLDLLDYVDSVEVLRDRLAHFDKGGGGIGMEEAKAEALRKYGLSL